MKKSFSLFLVFFLTIALFSVAGVAMAQGNDGTVVEEPTAEPTEEPTAEPTEEPTAEPTEEPTAEPTEEPTAEPTEEPTAEPTEEPTAEPTEEPTAEPTEEPTAEPTEEPTAEPTEEPTAEPTEEPTAEPTEEPVGTPAINSFTADPASLTDDGSSVLTTTLKWDVTGADTTLTLGGEDVTGLTEKVIELEQTTTYTLTASNAGGAAEANVTVTVLVEKKQVEKETVTTGDIESAAAYGKPYSSKIYLQNPNSGPSAFNVTYYDSSGQYNGTSDSLVAHGGTSVDVSGESNVLDGFLGSAVVSADNPLAALVVQSTSSADMLISNGFAGDLAAERLFAPSVQCNYASSKQVAEVIVQNTTGGDVDVSITLNKSQGPGATTVITGPFTIGSNEHHLFDVKSILGTDCNGWLGSAIVTSGGASELIVGTVNTFFSGSGNGAFSSEMVATGGDTLYFPTFQYNYASVKFNTNVAFQNTSSTDSIIVCTTYVASNGSTKGPVQKSLTALEKVSLRSSEFGLPNGTLGAAFAKAYSSGTCSSPGPAADTLIAVMNQFAFGDSAKQTSYGGFVGGTANIAYPLAQARASSSGLDAFFAVQNVSGGTVNVTATFYENGDENNPSVLTKTNLGNGAKWNPRIVSKSGTDNIGVGASEDWTGVVEISATGDVVGLSTVQTGNLQQQASYSAIPFTP